MAVTFLHVCAAAGSLTLSAISVTSAEGTHTPSGVAAVSVRYTLCGRRKAFIKNESFLRRDDPRRIILKDFQNGGGLAA